MTVEAGMTDKAIIVDPSGNTQTVVPSGALFSIPYLGIREQYEAFYDILK